MYGYFSTQNDETEIGNPIISSVCVCRERERERERESY